MCMAAIGPVLGLIGSVVSAAATMQAANSQAQAQEMQAAAYERQALIERQTAEYEAERQREKGSRLAGRQRAAYLQSGVSLDGSPTEIIAESTEENELDVAAIRYGGEVKAGNFETQAQIYRVSAQNTRDGGKLGALAPLIGGVGKFSSSFGGSVFGGG